MWAINQPYMGINCAPDLTGRQPTPNTDQETADLRDAINHYASSAKIDPQVILATILKESQGCVRAVTTGGAPVWNPGLMQSYNGLGTCHPAGGAEVVPCPRQTIFQMVFDGVQSDADDTLVGMFNNRSAWGTPRAIYGGLRMYNSGQFYDWRQNPDLSVVNGVVNLYVSHIANYLRGWDGVHH